MLEESEQKYTIFEDIDYKVVNKVLDDNKNLSFAFLENALDDRK